MVDPMFVVRLLESVSFWFEVKYPEAFANCRVDILTRELRFDPVFYNPHRVSSLTKLAAEYIRQQTTEKEHDEIARGG